MNCVGRLLNDFLDSYTRAFDKKDIDAILEHFAYPCLLITGQNAIGNKNKEELGNVIKRYSRYISGGQIEHTTSYTLTSLHSLDDDNLIISLLWRINNRLGQEVSKFHCHYHLIQRQQIYKIVVITLPEENF